LVNRTGEFETMYKNIVFLFPVFLIGFNVARRVPEILHGWYGEYWAYISSSGYF